MNPEQAKALRVPFPPEAIGQLPRAGIKLDYVGHAAVTDRLLSVDPEWTWEPVAFAADGTPFWSVNAGDAIMWIRLTVAGVTRLGVGIVKSDAFELEKQLISDALRNAAMRFGVALDLWSKEDLQSDASHRAGNDGQGRVPDSTPAATSPAIRGVRFRLKARASALSAAGVDVAQARQARLLPTIQASTADELELWGGLLSDLEANIGHQPSFDDEEPYEPNVIDVGTTHEAFANPS